MKISVLGTGIVGETIGTRFVELGYEVKMGSRSATNEKALAWAAKVGAGATVGTFAEAASFGEILFNCTKGEASLNALKLAGEENLAEKILVDVSNPLDFSKGMPPSLFVVNTNSLGEEIQQAFPKLKVVKSLNTMNCMLMMRPMMLAEADHDVFVCGNEPEAKVMVKKLLNQLGWTDQHIIDLGDITNARGTEQLLPIWIRLYGALGTANFNFKVVRA
jgi:predicted dinucleotide-binding enzyme